MLVETVTLQLPEPLYRRLESNARAMNQTLEDTALHALQVGSPPDWDDVPAEFQTKLAEMDRLSDDALWQIARSNKSEQQMDRYNELVEKNEIDRLTESERLELERLRNEIDRFVLHKAHANALLRWRGHATPIP
jgi:hypothetical protein